MNTDFIVADRQENICSVNYYIHQRMENSLPTLTNEQCLYQNISGTRPGASFLLLQWSLQL